MRAAVIALLALAAAPAAAGAAPWSAPRSGTVRTVSASDAAVAAAPAFAMSPKGRALIAYATTGGRIRLVTRRAG
jgi:hypothetical protein